MILGTGIDIIEVERIESATKKNAFIERIFTTAEQDYFEKTNYNPQTVAGAFAAKEAVAKALGVGFGYVKWKDVEILHDENGKPYVILHDGAYERMNDLAGKRVHVSISHIKQLAVAQAILED